jgi:hypothetical protein
MRTSPEDSNGATGLIPNCELDGHAVVVTGLPFHATKHDCRQALRDLEGEPELFGVTRRQVLGRGEATVSRAAALRNRSGSYPLPASGDIGVGFPQSGPLRLGSLLRGPYSDPV